MRAGTWILLPALLALGGCGKELLAGGQTGEVRAEVTDDPSARSSDRAEAPRFSSAARALGAAEGTAEVEATVELLDAGGRAHPIVERATARVRLASSAPALLGGREVEAGSYTAARITVTRVTADVTGGLAIGGIPITGTVAVLISQPLVIERPIRLVVTGGSSAVLQVDLNSEVWLATASPLTLRVAPAAFASALGVRVR